MYGKQTGFDVLKGKTLASVNVDEDFNRITFTTTDGKVYRQEHWQDCCEHVFIESIVGDIEDLIGEPLLVAEEVTNNEDPVPEGVYVDDCYMWTFYKLATRKGYVDIRWFGSSNGYYSVSVNFEEVR